MSGAPACLVARSGLPARLYPAVEARGGVVVVGLKGSWGGRAEPPRNAPPGTAGVDAKPGPSVAAGAADMPAGAGGGARSEADAPPPLPAELLALRAAGFSLLVPDLTWRHPGAPDAMDPVADHEVIADLGAALGLLPQGPRFVVGIGRGGNYARLAACAVRGLDGVVSLGGRVWYSGVSALRPIQPLDLLPGLACALQCHFDATDPETPPAQVDELLRRLASVSRPWQVFRYDAGQAAAEWRGVPAVTAWGRARAFLVHLSAERLGAAPSRRAPG